MNEPRSARTVHFILSDNIRKNYAVVLLCPSYSWAVWVPQFIPFLESSSPLLESGFALWRTWLANKIQCKWCPASSTPGTSGGLVHFCSLLRPWATATGKTWAIPAGWRINRRTHGAEMSQPSWDHPGTHQPPGCLAADHKCMNPVVLSPSRPK